MTTPPFQPTPPSEHPLPPAGPPKRRSRLPLILLTAGAVLFLILLTVVVTLAASGGSQPTAKPTTPSAWDREQAAGAAPADAGEQGVPTEEPTPGPTLHASDITLSLKTTSKQCYGYGVGCSLTVQVKMSYTGLTPDPGDTWQVTYEISGIENGPLVGSFEVTGDTYDSNEEMVDTKSSKAKPAIKVTGVEKVGI